MRHWTPILPFLLLAGTPAASQQPARDNAQTPQPPQHVIVTGDKPKQAKKVCVRSVPTGSIMPQTTCRTQEEWDEAKAASLRNFQILKDQQQTQRNTQTSADVLLSN
jgi:hypothetical protein